MNRTGNHTTGCETPQISTEPLKWIGLSAAIASVYFGILLLVDFIRILRKSKNLFTPRWFQLNATTLTILAIATKLSGDLNSDMPNEIDQFSKLTGIALLSTAVTNFTLSIGNMDPSSIFSNVFALVIFVITFIVKIAIQIKTEVIDRSIVISLLGIPHILVMLFMFLSLLVLVWWAVLVPALVSVGEDNDASNELSWWPPDNLVQQLKRSWLLALIRRPVVGWRQFHVLSMVSSLPGFGVVAILYLHRWDSSWDSCCTGDYKWSTAVVAICQGIVIFVDFIGRCTYFTKFYFRIGEKDSNFENAESRKSSTVFHAVEYWDKKITDLEYERNISCNTTGSCLKRFGYRIKILFISAISKVSSALKRSDRRIMNYSSCCSTFLGILVKFSGYIGFGCVTGVLVLLIIIKAKPDKIVDYIVYGFLATVFVAPLVVHSVVKTILQCIDRLSSDSDPNLEKFAGQLKGVPCRIRNFCNRKKDVEEWIEKGRKKQHAELKDLTKKSTLQGGFPGVARIFDSRVPSLFKKGENEERENCWILPIVTLVYIAINIPGVSEDDFNYLLKAVEQGLKYVRYVEHHLDSRKGTYNARKQAEEQWKTIKAKNQRCDENPRNEDARQKLEELAKKGEDQFRKSEYKEIAWNNLHKIAETIRIQYYGDSLQNIPIFQWISETISDTITASLTNLPRAIFVQCTKRDHKSDPLDIEEEISQAATIFGETQELMTSEDLLSPIFSRPQDEMQSKLGDDRRRYIDEWIKEVGGLPPRPQDD